MHVEGDGRVGKPLAEVDDALHGHRTVGREVVGRTLQQGLQRRLELVDGVDVEHGVHRRARPLDRGAVLDDEPLVDDVLQREEEAPFGDGIVAVHLEDVGTGVDLQVERTVAARPERIARDGEFDLDARLHVQRQRDIHLAAGVGLLLPLAFEHHLLAGEVVDRIDPGRFPEGHEVGARYIGLAGQRHEERRTVVGRGGDIHLHEPLVARNTGGARGVDTAVERVVVLRGGVEHHHLSGCDAYVVGDVREVLQAQVDVEAPLVALGVEYRDVRSPEAVALDAQHRPGHGVGHLCEIDARRQPRDADFAREVGLAALPLEHQVGGGVPPGIGNDAREDRVEQPHVEAVDVQTGIVAHLRRGVEAPHQRIALMTVGDGNARTVAQEIPARGEAQRRCGYVVDLKAVEQDVGRDLARMER